MYIDLWFILFHKSAEVKKVREESCHGRLGRWYASDINRKQLTQCLEGLIVFISPRVGYLESLVRIGSDI